jgi:hypothetical protein
MLNRKHRVCSKALTETAPLLIIKSAAMVTVQQYQPFVEYNHMHPLNIAYNVILST